MMGATNDVHRDGTITDTSLVVGACRSHHLEGVVDARMGLQLRETCDRTRPREAVRTRPLR